MVCERNTNSCSKRLGDKNCYLSHCFYSSLSPHLIIKSDVKEVPAGVFEELCGVGVLVGDESEMVPDVACGLAHIQQESCVVPIHVLGLCWYDIIYHHSKL